MIKVGIIGAGRIGRVHSESITKYVKGAEIKPKAIDLIISSGGTRPVNSQLSNDCSAIANTDRTKNPNNAARPLPSRSTQFT